MTQTLLHFGYAKTATTYLQRHVFPKAKGINYLGKPYDLSKSRFEALAEKYLHLHVQKVDRFDPFFEHEDEMRIRPSGEIGFEHLIDHLRAILSTQALNVWSHEGYLRPGRKSSALDRKVAIANIREVFHAAGSDDVKALIVLRDTKKMLASYAIQFHRDFNYLRIGDLSLDDLVAFRNGDRDDRYMALIWRLWYEYLDYAAMIDDLVEGFGADSIYVLRYEELVADWSLLENLLQSIQPDIKCLFPHLRENTTEAKPYQLSPFLQTYLDSIEVFDLKLLFPSNYAGLETKYFRPQERLQR